MAANSKVLQICSMCRHVRDDREFGDERWVTKKAYLERTGTARGDCRLSYTYCPVCSSYLQNYIQAA